MRIQVIALLFPFFSMFANETKIPVKSSIKCAVEKELSQVINPSPK